MASSESRIPKCSRPCFKRPNENVLPQIEKRCRMDIPVPSSTSKGFHGTLTISSMNNIGRFSETNKRAMLQPQKSMENVRQTVSATSISLKSVVPSSAVKSKKKIPAWDLKSRLAEMEKSYSALQQELKSRNQRIAALEEEKMHESEKYVTTVGKLEQELRTKSDELKKVTKALSDKIEKVTKSLTDQLEMVTESMTNELEKVTKAKIELQDNNQQLSLEVKQQGISLDKCQAEIVSLKNLLSGSQEENVLLHRQVNELVSKLCKEESSRRKLHNTIQELKGNIRVFCRIRPALPCEVERNLPMSMIQVKGNSKTLEISRSFDNSSFDKKKRMSHEFTFDHVFHSASTQDDVFFEISHLVQSAIDGYNVCIFAYGQTGSGKTYTMDGPVTITDSSSFSLDSQIGVIPRSVHQIFNSAAELKDKGWKYEMETSFMEIYNENIRDLLVDKGQHDIAKCEIKRSACTTNDSYVSNVKTVHVTTEKEVYDLLRKAKIHRSVAATNCNEHSSRSHYIFQMKLTGENALTGEKCEGILNLVDLAGSERVKESGSEGERLREAQNINKSLSSLGNVILALLHKADHIPYRNSKLTHLLMNSLGGNSKTLMFVNINPCEESFNETVNSLRFATKVNRCIIGAAEKRK